jgi:signal transduction histidine kinase
MNRLTTRTRLVLAALALLIPTLIVAGVILYEAFKRSQTQVTVTQFSTADVVSQSVFQMVYATEASLMQLAQQDAIRAIDQRPDEAAVLMDDFRSTRPYINGVFLLGPDSEAIRTSGGVDLTTLPDSFKMTAEGAIVGGQPAVSDALKLSGSEVEVVAIIVPVFPNPDPSANSAAGTPVASATVAAQAPSGALGAFFSVERLVSAYMPATGFTSGSDISIALVTSSGHVISIPGRANDPSQILRDGPELDNVIKSALGGQRSQATFTDPSGLERVTVAVPIAFSGNDWAAVVSGPTITEYAPNDVLIRRSIIAGIVVILLSILGALLAAQWLSQPFRTLTKQAYSLSQGGPDTTLQPGAPRDAVALANTIREMADRLRAQVRDTETAREEIARQAQQLRDLLRRTVRLQEDERRRIASDIHDAVSPLITGALYQAQAVRLGQTNGNGNGNGDSYHADDSHDSGADVAHDMQEVSDLLERAMRELHDVIFDLRPPDLDDIGVVAAVQRHVDQVNRGGFPCRLDSIGEEYRLPPEVRLAIYRIVQEALHNAMRHARADESVVRMEWATDRLRVTIQDDGSGFDVTSTPRRSGLGLLSMRERAASIGATLEIASRRGAGTAIIVERVGSEVDLSPDSSLLPDLDTFDVTQETGDDVDADGAESDPIQSDLE